MRCRVWVGGHGRTVRCPNKATYRVRGGRLCYCEKHKREAEQEDFGPWDKIGSAKPRLTK